MPAPLIALKPLGILGTTMIELIAFTLGFGIGYALWGFVWW